MGKQWGTYCLFQCDKTDSKEKKFDLVRAGVDRLIEEAKEFPVEPIFNTLQIIVHEDLHFTDQEDWYADEKQGYNPKPFWAMTVGIKFTAEGDPDDER